MKMLEFILILSLFTLGLFVIGHNGLILTPVRNFIAKLLGGTYRESDGEQYFEFKSELVEGLWKPIWGCPVCMVSVWGICLYFTHTLHIQNIYELIISVVCSAGLNFIIFNNLIKKWLYN